MSACKFFLLVNFEVESSSSDSSSEDDKNKKELLSHHTGNKFSKRKKVNLKKAIKSMARKERRKMSTRMFFSSDFFPVDMIRNA